MAKVFRLFHPGQIARHVKGFHRGSFFIAQQGPYYFDNGTVCYESLPDEQALQMAAAINRQVRDLRQFRP